MSMHYFAIQDTIMWNYIMLHTLLRNGCVVWYV